MYRHPRRPLLVRLLNSSIKIVQWMYFPLFGWPENTESRETRFDKRRMGKYRRY